MRALRSLSRLRGRVGVGASGGFDPSAPSARPPPPPTPPPGARGPAGVAAGTSSGVEAGVHAPRPAYIARSASVTGSVAARSAGNRPPTKPIASAHFSPSHSSCGETRNSKLKLATPPARVEAV